MMTLEKITKDSLWEDGLYYCIISVSKRNDHLAIQHHFINCSVDEEGVSHTGVSWDESASEFNEYDDGWSLDYYDYRMKLPDTGREYEQMVKELAKQKGEI